MSAISPNAMGGMPFYTSMGPTTTPGGFSGNSFGTPALPFGFGFPSYGDPMFYFMPAASSFFINRLLGFANGSAVNINVGPTPSTLGFGALLLGLPFYSDNGTPAQNTTGGTTTQNPWGTTTQNPWGTPTTQQNPLGSMFGTGYGLPMQQMPTWQGGVGGGGFFGVPGYYA